MLFLRRNSALYCRLVSFTMVQQFFLLSFVAALCFSLVFFTAYKPYWYARTRIAECASVSEIVSVEQSMDHAQFAALEEEYEKLSDELKLYTSLTANSEDICSTIASVASRFAIDIKRCEEAVSADAQQSSIITCECVGEYRDMCAFLAALAQESLYAEYEQLSMTRVDAGIVNLSMIMRVIS